MDKLNEPSRYINEFFQEMIVNKHNNEKNSFLRKRLQTIEDTLVSGESEYIEKARSVQLYTINEHDKVLEKDGETVITAAEMKALYNQDFVSKPGSRDIGRDMYDYLKSLALEKFCPYCSVSRVKTLDHYLPKGKYPTYAITPANLVPSCRDCNTEKETATSNTLDEMFIHPYFEDVNNINWLNAEMEKNIWPISFNYGFDMRDQKNITIINRIRHQLETLDVIGGYNDRANRQFRYRVRDIQRNYSTGGIEGLKDFLEESEESCRKAELNSWEACMYRAILDSDWFFTDAIIHLKKYYKELDEEHK